MEKSQGKSKLKTIGLIFLLALFFVLDRFFKYMAAGGYLDNSVQIFKDIFQLKFSANYNIAFSLPFSGNYLSATIFVLVVILFYYLVYLIKKQALREAYYFSFIILGAISNLADRFEFGYVVDYLDLKYFTVFNIADVMIVGGAGMVALLNVAKNQKAYKDRPVDNQ